MTSANPQLPPWWPGFLDSLSCAWLDAHHEHCDEEELIPPEFVRAGWLGAPAATEEALAALRNRLGTDLPPDYLEFLRASDGWLRLGHLAGSLLPAQEVGWFAALSPETLAAWREAVVRFAVETADTDPEDDLPGPIGVPDERYFVYDERQRPLDFRAEYLPDLLQIGAVDEVTYLLNPAVRTPAGEWEAWALSARYPGARRFQTFRDLAEHEYTHDPVLAPERYQETVISLSGLPHPAGFASGTEMLVGQFLRRQSLTSVSGSHTLVHQDDGDLVMYRHSDGIPVWSAGTAGTAAGILVLGEDGDLVLRDAMGITVWRSDTAGAQVDRVVVEDGGFSLRDPAGRLVWSTDKEAGRARARG